MITNYFKIAIRNMMRNKAFSLINIAGLSVGLATCLLILLYIFDERSYDQYHKDGDRVYRIVSSNKGETWAAVSAPVAAAVKLELPEVEQSTRLMTFPDIAKMLLKYEDKTAPKQFFETNGYYVDSNFFQILTYTFKYGDPASALGQPNSMVISETLANKFFGNTDPVGKAILVNTPFGEFNYMVRGVFTEAGHPSHIPASYLLSMHNNDMWNWVQGQTSMVGNSVFFTYLKLKPGVNSHQFEKKLQGFFQQKAGPSMKAAGFTTMLSLQPLRDIYLKSHMNNEIAPNGSSLYLSILASIAAFLLIIAGINFMNLSTARSEKRAREVGVRKVLGARRKSLVGQFLGESFLFCFLALALALMIIQLVLPVFNQFTQKEIRFFDRPELFAWAAGLTFLTALFSGIYPAFYLSAFRPVSVLKGKLVNSFSATAIRKGLVVFQFTVSICLMLAAIVIWQQLVYLNSQSLGFNKQQKIVLPLQQAYLNAENNYTNLKNELLKIPGINAVTSGSAYPGAANLNDMLFYAAGKSTSDNVDVHLSTIESDYIPTLGFTILSGRGFSKDFKADSASIILNETAVKKLGYSNEEAVGKKIRYDVNSFHGSMQIVGVVKDFNFESLHRNIEPFGFTTAIFGDRFGFTIASLNTRDYYSTIHAIEKTWKQLHPAIPFVYSFIDQDFQRNYEKDQNTSSIILFFTAMAIIIASLGLFGLAAFSAEQRRKEIGIRKVLGATVAGITGLLSKDFLKLVVVAFLIAIPIGWWAMSQWLESFAYQVPIRPWMILFTGLLSIFIAFATVSFQAIRAALTNPAISMKAE